MTFSASCTTPGRQATFGMCTIGSSRPTLFRYGGSGAILPEGHTTAITPTTAAVNRSKERQRFHFASVARHASMTSSLHVCETHRSARKIAHHECEFRRDFGRNAICPRHPFEVHARAISSAIGHLCYREHRPLRDELHSLPRSPPTHR